MAVSFNNVQAAYSGTLEFVNPTDTANSTDSIPVWVRFTLDQFSDPLILTGDPSETPPFGVDPSVYSSLTDFYSYDWQTGTSHRIINGTINRVDSIYLNTWFSCSGSFTSSCTVGPEYDFNWAYQPEGGIIGSNNIFILPGDSRDYLFGTFTPTNGSAAEGVYEFFGTGLSFNIVGEVTGIEVDDQGNPVSGIPAVFANASASFDLASTHGSTPFTRTVTAVPLPNAFWLFGSFVLATPRYLKSRKA